MTKKLPLMEQQSWERRLKLRGKLSESRIEPFNFDKVIEEKEIAQSKVTDDITRDISKNLQQIDYLTKIAYSEINTQ